MTVSLDITQQLQSLREAAGLYQAKQHGILKVSGQDAEKLLQSLTTNDIKALSIGHLQQSALLDRKGKVQALFMVLRQSEQAFLLLTDPACHEWVQQHLTMMRFIQQVEISDESALWTWLWIIGPEALSLCGDAVGVHGDMLIHENQILIPPDRFTWHMWQDQRWGVQRVHFLLPTAEVAELQAQLNAVEIPEVAEAAVNLMRLAGGVPEFGVEIDQERILLESGLSDTYSRNKGCYPGQEVVERICAYGDGKTPYKLNIYSIKSDVKIEPQAKIYFKGDAVGTVAHSLYNPTEEQTLVAAYIATKILDQDLKLAHSDGELSLK